MLMRVRSFSDLSNASILVLDELSCKLSSSPGFCAEYGRCLNTFHAGEHGIFLVWMGRAGIV